MAIVTSVQGVYSKFQSVLFLQGLLVCCGRLCGCWWSIRIPKIIRRFPKQKRPILLRALLGIVQLRYHNFFSTRGFFLLKVFFYSRFFSTRGFFLLEVFSTRGFFLLKVFFYSRFLSTRGFFYSRFFSTRGFFQLKVFFYSRFFSTQGFLLLEVFFYSNPQPSPTMKPMLERRLR